MAFQASQAKKPKKPKTVETRERMKLAQQKRVLLNPELNKGINFHEADSIAIEIADAHVQEFVNDAPDLADLFDGLAINA